METPASYYDMTDLKEENKRISKQVASMSTQLMESISKQSDLEEKLNHATRKVANLQKDAEKYAKLKSDYESAESQLEKTQEQLAASKTREKEETKLRIEAEDMVKQLEGEVEDLTASLFAEANNMVADARKEKHTTEILNRKLLEAVKEKDNALETMKAQLKHMKKVVERMEPDSALSNNSSNRRHSAAMSDSDNMSLRKSTTSNSFQSEMSNPPSVIFSPNISAVRYDLNLYTEFLKFINKVSSCKSIRDTATDSKLLRRLNNDEISPILKIDNAPGISLWSRKSLLNAMIDGMVVIEPISGVNETYQIGYSSPSLNIPSGDKSPHLFNYPTDSPPVATHDACALCGECRSDNVTHARMHTLKVQSKEDNGTLVVQNSYPLCLWCVSRVRQTCDIYAFLRELKLGAWNLEDVSLKDGTVSSKCSGMSKVATKTNKKSKKVELHSKRMSFMGGLGISTSSSRSKPQVETTSKTTLERIGQPSTNVERAWLQLCKLRSMLHWAHIGVWSINDSVSIKIGPTSNKESDDEDDYEKVSSVDFDNDTPTSTDLKSSGIDSVLSDAHSSIRSSRSDNLDCGSKNEVGSLSNEPKEETNGEEDDTIQPDDNDKADRGPGADKELPAENPEVIEVGDETRESIDIIGEYHEDNDSNEQSSSLEEENSSTLQFADAQENV